MLSFDRIDEIGSFDASPARVLSTYLSLDPALLVRRSHTVVFEDLVKTTHDKLEPALRHELLHEAAEAERMLREHKPQGLGVAIFSCASRGFRHVEWLGVRVENFMAYDSKPDVAPLAAVADDYERYTVALVDKRHARLFTVFAGQIEEMDAFSDDVPKKHAQGALAQSRFQRHHDNRVLWHVKRVVDRLSEMQRRRRFDRLIIGGPTEAAGELQRLLPRALAAKLSAVIPADISAGTQEILATTLEIERSLEQEVERRVLDELLGAAAAGGRATSGIEPTLDALWLGDVRTLVVADRMHEAGSECPNCGRLEPGTSTTCRACGASMRAVGDLFHRAIGRTLEQAGSVEVLHNDAGRRLREAAGGLGAILRFPSPTRGAAGLS